MLEEILSPIDQHGILLGIYLAVFFCSLFIIFTIYQRSKKMEVWSGGTKNLMFMMIALSLIPLDSIINSLDALFGTGALLDQNRPPLLRFISANLTIIGLTLFILFYTFYVKGTVNLSKLVRKFLNFSGIILVGLGLIALGVNLSDFVSQASSRSNIYFITLAVVALLILITSMAFSVIDIHRISNKLVQVRLTMSTLGGCFIICVMLFLALGLAFASDSSASYMLISSLYALRILSIMPLSLSLFWGLFVPLKIQEWTGILPPSFKVLKLKQKRLRMGINYQ
ncbi:MAG: hypothetical protein ACFFBD_20300 [Candidatus Hodarchaeota archaeon]